VEQTVMLLSVWPSTQVGVTKVVGTCEPYKVSGFTLYSSSNCMKCALQKWNL